MKLVDRKTFLGLPKGTVFCKFPMNHESYASKIPIKIGAPQIKGDSLTNDFYTCTLGEDMMSTAAKGSDDYFRILFEMQKNLNQDIPFELVGGRDGFFDDENVGFMIFSKTEVQEMITELSECLKIAYQDETDDLQIIKRTNKKLVVNEDKTDVEISHWYIAKRKGRIFGFWHVVGHEADWWDGDVYSHTTDTLKGMEEYLASYNEVYNNDKPYKIIYPPKE